MLFYVIHVKNEEGCLFSEDNADMNWEIIGFTEYNVIISH